MSTTDCPSCGAVLVPGLGCCAARATLIAKGHRKPVITARPVRKARTPRDLPQAFGSGAKPAHPAYVPGASQVMRVRTPMRNVGHGRDNYAMARNTTLLHAHWVPDAR